VQATVELYAAPEPRSSTGEHPVHRLRTSTSRRERHDARAVLHAESRVARSRSANFFAIATRTSSEPTCRSRSSTNGGALTSVYAPAAFEWDEPETQTHKPEFKIPTGNQGGFNFKCTYTNTTNQTVGFGESATDEMCFFWEYYYPSQGAHVCVHTEQFGGLDLCCPDAGAQICDMVTQL
jgi:hypothetical protein